MKFIQKFKNILTPRLLVISFLIVVLIVSGIVLVKEYRVLYKIGVLKRPQHPRELPEKITINDIKPWMTFDYINKQFNLPDGYFKDALNISDSAYPNLPIDKFFKRDRIDPRTAVEKIKQLILARNSESPQPTSQ